MAHEVPRPEPPPGSASAWPRAWIAYDEYRLIHDRYIEVLYREGIVESDNLVFTEVAEGRKLRQVHLEGEIVCALGVRVRVSKWLDVRQATDGVEVLSTFYQYHAWRPRAGRRREQPLIRYDQAHEALHRHRFEPTGASLPPQALSLEAMPRLDAVVREAVEIAVHWGG